MEEPKEETPEIKSQGSQKIIAPLDPDLKAESPILNAPAAAEPVTPTPPTVTVSESEPAAQSYVAPSAPQATYSSSTTAYNSSYVEAELSSDNQSLDKKWFGQTRAYLAEYAVMLITLAALLFMVNGFFGGIINSIGGSDATSWYDAYEYKVSLGLLAGVSAVLPLLFVLTRRTTGTESDAPLVKESNWRKAFLGTFLIVLGITAVSYAIAFMYVVISAAANSGLAVDVERPVWKSLLTSGFGFVLFSLSALLYARDYRPADDDLSMWRRIHRYGLVVFAVVLSVVFAAVPLNTQRGVYVDSLKSGDLQAIQSAISTYASKERKLPAALTDLDLKDEVKKRNSKFNYKYEADTAKATYKICANFQTETEEESNPFTAFSGSGANADEDKANSDPTVHKKGEQCFEKTVSAARSYNSSSSRNNSSINLEEFYNNLGSESYDDFNYDEDTL